MSRFISDQVVHGEEQSVCLHTEPDDPGIRVWVSRWSVVWQTAGGGVTFIPAIPVQFTSVSCLFVCCFSSKCLPVWWCPHKQGEIETLIFPFIDLSCQTIIFFWTKSSLTLLLPRRELSSLNLSGPWQTQCSWHFLNLIWMRCVVVSVCTLWLYQRNQSSTLCF